MRGYSVDAFLAMLAGRITVQTGAIVVGGFLTVAAAAHYAIAARLVDMAKNLLRSATTTLTPAVSEREATGDLDGVRRVLLTGTRWVLYLVLPIHLGMLFFGRPFLARWIGGPQYADWCFPAVAILSATLTIGVAQSVASRILYGMGKLRLFARLALVEAVAEPRAVLRARRAVRAGGRGGRGRGAERAVLPVRDRLRLPRARRECLAVSA